MPNPLDPFGWINLLLEWFAREWMKSGGESVRGSIEQLTAPQFPDFGQDWFMSIWNTTFGLSLVIGFGAVMIHAIFFMFKANYPTMGAALVGFLRLAFNGVFLLVIVTAVMWLADVIVQVMKYWIDQLLEGTSFETIFSFVGDISMINIWFRLGIANVASTTGNLFYLHTLVMNAWIAIFVVWYLFSGAFGVGWIGRFVRSLIMAGLLTAIFARVFEVFNLGVFAVIINAAESLGLPAISVLVLIIVASVITLMIPAFLMIGFTISAFKTEQKLNVKAFIQRQFGAINPFASNRELASERVGRIKQVSDASKEAAGGALRWAAIAAAGAAFAKVGAAIGAKIAGSAPTPQTKVAAVGLLAAKAGAEWMEHRTKDYINRRVGRPGAARARSRAGA